MPSTLTGLLLFVVLLLPGFVFLAVFTFDRPRHRLTTLQETAAVVLASIVADLVALIGFTATRTIAPGITPDIGRLIRERNDYLISNYQAIFIWFVGLVIASSALAGLAGLVTRLAPVHPSWLSSWWTLFELWQPTAVRHIQCELEDGSYVSGVLGDWNIGGDDSPDRDLILNAPIQYRAAKDEQYQDHNVSTVCVSAGRIVAMFVTYSDPQPEVTSSPASPPSALSVAAAEEASSVALPEAGAPAQSVPYPASSKPA